ncbi:CrcB family protein [Sporosarcina thermotolerans]|uniref:Fluoride-specific ion channel FluC n=1 Tax=Sporosarcina thermotolerans TaxID=633404 RepID=A0AAW9A469_9BACL|nr:CrcB family protein [Sporosarcina thermotolerans]MDW0116026.1 CrcB family protein [Sporosarcina thermotolerans]WHT49790.1 CrcB family protein [Sporosarcina thermotolerans]
MTVIDILIIGAGGFIGAVIRYLLSGKFNKEGSSLPFGTLIVNIAGSLLIGIVVGLGVPKLWTLFLVSGFAGALTTFSTLFKELLQLWFGNRKRQFIGYILLTYGVGILVAFVGFIIGKAL